MKFPVILADPPWSFNNWSGKTPDEIVERGYGAAANYSTMTTDELCQLSVPAADDSYLLLWACWPLLPDAIRVIQAWGFEYKTLAWVWVKSNPTYTGFYMGMGYYTRSNSEPCLLGVRGKPPKPFDRGILSLIYAPVREHSRKPDEQYGKIERLYPQGPYLEMFARRPRPGWQVWGNEVESTVEIVSNAA